MKIVKNTTTTYFVDDNIAIIEKETTSTILPFEYYVHLTDENITVFDHGTRSRIKAEEIEEKYNEGYFDCTIENAYIMVTANEEHNMFKEALATLLEKTAKKPTKDIRKAAKKALANAYDLYDFDPVDEIKEIELDRLIAYYNRCDRLRKEN